MRQCKREFILSVETIDRLSRLFARALREAGTDKRDVIRIRRSLEEVLGTWLEKLEGMVVLYKTVQKFGRLTIEVCVEGMQISIDEEAQGFLLGSRILSQAGLALNYSYKNGRNCLICCPPPKAHIRKMVGLAIAILAALFFGGIIRILPEGVKDIAIGITEPFYNTILDMLQAISSPMIFLAVCWGIISIGDLITVGKIGKKLIIRMVISTFAVGTVFILLASPFFKIVWGKNKTAFGGFEDIYTMVLEIIPSDIISPFLEGNALQIIFLGGCIGIVLLILEQRASAFRDVIVQANEVVHFLMEVIGKFVPVFVFLSIFNLLLFDTRVNFGGIIKVFALAIPACLFLILFYVIIVAARFQINPILLIKKQFPTYFIALLTGSSTAAFATNLETCTVRLGIPNKIANFAIQLGQVIYKPGAVIGFLAIALCMAEYYDIEITVIWLITAVLTAGFLAMAAPPIPSGALFIFIVMFAQLGIPSEAIIIVVGLNSILDFVMTASGLICIQAELILTAGNLKILDKKKLAQGYGKQHEQTRRRNNLDYSQ